MFQSKVKGSVRLEEVVAVTAVADHIHNRQNTFAVVARDKTYFLSSGSQAVTKGWIKTLNPV